MRYFFSFLVEDPFLVIVRDSIIYGIPLNPDDKSNDAMVPVAGLHNGYDVDFDDNEQAIYWVEHPVRFCPKMLFSEGVCISKNGTCVVQIYSGAAYARHKLYSSELNCPPKVT